MAKAEEEAIKILSEQKTAANRANARKSTGPKTPEGKERVSRNALKHGLLSGNVVVEWEEVSVFREFEQNMWKRLQPVGELEELLVDRIVTSAWRLRRLAAYETHCFGDLVGFAMDLSQYDNIGKLGRYEAQIERCFYRALHELQRLQAAREGEAVPPPLVADVNLHFNNGA
jgi:hypothetical protein